MSLSRRVDLDIEKLAARVDAQVAMHETRLLTR
jgi:hypothetical protein